ncbi:MAG TPA: T9SS type A sorting domain-containing protein, partial [Chitinophagales bacterium]|nr:T9SS type A sorting domain-containing protein [Chitinophagales bacterium]
VTDGVAFTPNATDTYTVTGTSNGCSATATVTVTVNAAPTVTANASASSVCAGGQVTLTGGGATTYAWSGGVTDGVAFAPNATDTYTVTGTSNGCSAAATVTVTVNAAPTVTATASASTICAGSQVTLTGGGATTYAWSGGVTDGVAFTPNATDTYTVTGTSNGCSATATVTVTVNSAPTVTLNLPTDTAELNGGTITLSGGSPAGGTYSGVGVTGTTFNPTVNGLGTVTITYTASDNGCSASATGTIEVVNTVGITSVSALSGVQIFPNPTQGQFVISLVAPADKAVNVEITDATGKLVNAFVMTRQIQDVNIDTYAAGVYFVRLASGDSRSTHRIVKQ